MLTAGFHTRAHYCSRLHNMRYLPLIGYLNPSTQRDGRIRHRHAVWVFHVLTASGIRCVFGPRCPGKASSLFQRRLTASAIGSFSFT